MLEEKIIELKKELVEFAGLVEIMITKSMKGLLNKERTTLAKSRCNHQ